MFVYEIDLKSKNFLNRGMKTEMRMTLEKEMKNLLRIFALVHKELREKKNRYTFMESHRISKMMKEIQTEGFETDGDLEREIHYVVYFLASFYIRLIRGTQRRRSRMEMTRKHFWLQMKKTNNMENFLFWLNYWV